MHSKPKVLTAGRAREGWWSRHQRTLIPYLFIAPNLVVFTAFLFIPLVFTLYISLHDWDIIGVPSFIGAANYSTLISDSLFWQALRNTTVYTLGTVPLSMALGLAVAILLDRKLPARTLLRSVFFVPVIISAVATALIASWLFNDSYGVVNKFLGYVGIGPVPWLSSPVWAMPTLIVTTLWTRIGFCMVIYLAGLQGIASEYYDAAQVDGATKWQRFRYITLPSLRPTTFFLLIISVIYSFHVFDLIYVMTAGGPGFSTTVLVQYIYQEAFTNSRFGYASAMGMVLFALILALTVSHWRLTRQSEAT